MPLSLVDIPFFLVVFLFFFFAVFLLLNAKGKKLSNQLLGFFFLIVGLNILDGYCLYRGIYQFRPHAAFWLNALPALFGPVIYFYTKSLLYQDFRLQWRDIWHAGLFLSVFLLFVVIYHRYPLDYKRVFLERAISYSGFELLIGNFILISQLGIYLYMAYREIHKYEAALHRQFSEFEMQNLSWLRFTILGYSVIYVFIILYTIARFTIWEGRISLGGVMMIVLLFLLFISVILFRALKQSKLFIRVEELETKNEKYAYSTLTGSEAQATYQKLLHLMETEQPWLDPKLTLGDLAKQLSVPAKTLSQVINETSGQSFFDFINRHRIAAAQQLLKNPRDHSMTISEIMYEVGFNSKSSFNTAFKKYTNLTPSAFKRKYRE